MDERGTYAKVLTQTNYNNLPANSFTGTPIMAYTKQRFIFRTAVIADALSLVLSVIITTSLFASAETGNSLGSLLLMRFSLANIVGSAFLFTLWILLFKQFGMYNPLQHRESVIGEGIQITKVCTLGILAFASAATFFKISLFSPAFIVIFWLLMILLDLGLRRTVRKIVKNFNLGDHNHRSVLIIGGDQQAEKCGNLYRDGEAAGYTLLGYLDDKPETEQCKARHKGTLDHFPEFVATQVVDEIVIAKQLKDDDGRISRIISEAYDRGINIRFPCAMIFPGITNPHGMNRVRQELFLSHNGEMENDIVLYSGYQFGARYMIKRLFDIFVASTAILLISPLLAGAALLIAIDSGLPVLFIQKRYGYNGRIIHVFKFRTMVTNAEALQDELRKQNERDGAAFKLKNDPRVTTIGKFLRKTSIDELPQLFNVVMGDMSLVGPRPLPLADYERMSDIAHLRRMSVLPGITGPWQVSGREDISFEEWMQMDLDYIDNWRFSHDIKILLSTIPVVLFGTGAS